MADVGGLRARAASEGGGAARRCPQVLSRDAAGSITLSVKPGVWLGRGDRAVAKACRAPAALVLCFRALFVCLLVGLCANTCRLT